ncbi:Rossmann-like and DUF2520 domain-containing protein [Jejudonia soesokkakensis]|uniref:Rossmann-like and DUF2520 domain-containing protein n=1 Tax=Jejudonia soesokkakensis TaxID=1323432 RepID=A0ABW2MY18_9FLAO
MIRVCFLGFGNVNYHLCKAFVGAKDVAVIQVYNRSKMDSVSFLKDIPTTTTLSELKEADVYIIGIPDNAIASFSEAIPVKNKLVIHTSGGVSITELSENNRRGVLWPLQTFSKSKDVDFKTIPLCLEAEAPTDLELLKRLGNSIAKTIVAISSKERATLHLSAVFVNNFVNHLYGVSETLLRKKNIDFNLLKPLILETATKIETLSPSEAQTGPAKRNDTKTIEKHLHLLEETPYQQLYKTLTQAIANEKL